MESAGLSLFFSDGPSSFPFLEGVSVYHDPEHRASRKTSQRTEGSRGQAPPGAGKSLEHTRAVGPVFRRHLAACVASSAPAAFLLHAVLLFVTVQL